MENKFKEVKYRITNIFEFLEIGTIINSILISEDLDSGKVLLYHPKIKGDLGGCGSFEICKYDPIYDFYVSLDEDSYVNSEKNIETRIFGKDFKFKRKIYKDKK